MRWKSIKSAPIKTPILITDGTIITICELHSVTNRYDNKKTMIYMTGFGFGGYEWEYDFEYEQATHWMPLPELPRKKEKKP